MGGFNLYTYATNPTGWIDPLGWCGKVSIDNNALINGLEKGEIAALDAAIAGRTPIVSRAVVREFLAGGGDKAALRQFLVSRGGRLAVSGSEAEAEASALRDIAGAIKPQPRSLKPQDSRVVASAVKEDTNIITRDKKLLGFLNDPKSGLSIIGEGY